MKNFGKVSPTEHENSLQILMYVAKGFFIGALPIFVNELFIFRQLDGQVLVGTIKYGIGGLIVGISYAYLHKIYPKTTKYVLWGIILVYYIYILILITIGTYLSI